MTTAAPDYLVDNSVWVTLRQIGESAVDGNVISLEAAQAYLRTLDEPSRLGAQLIARRALYVLVTDVARSWHFEIRRTREDTMAWLARDCDAAALRSLAFAERFPTPFPITAIPARDLIDHALGLRSLPGVSYDDYVAALMMATTTILERFDFGPEWDVLVTEVSATMPSGGPPLPVLIDWGNDASEEPYSGRSADEAFNAAGDRLCDCGFLHDPFEGAADDSPIYDAPLADLDDDCHGAAVARVVNPEHDPVLGGEAGLWMCSSCVDECAPIIGSVVVETR